MPDYLSSLNFTFLPIPMENIAFKQKFILVNCYVIVSYGVTCFMKFPWYAML